MSGDAIEGRLEEDRRFPPDEATRARALVTGRELHERADADRLGFC